MNNNGKSVFEIKEAKLVGVLQGTLDRNRELGRKKDINNNKKTSIVLSIVFAIVLWISITTIIQAFKYPEMSQTELFIHIPKSFICNFKTIG